MYSANLSPARHDRHRAPLFLCAALLAGCAHHGTVAKAPLVPPVAAPAVAPTGDGQFFAEPKAAVDALLAACASGNENAVVAVFGQQARSLVSTGNAERDRERCTHFTTSAKQMTRIDPDAPGRVHIVVGHDDWTLPIPLVQTTRGWQFDVAAGRKEVAARRVGANELETIRVLRAFVSAQKEYKETHGAYAQRFMSRPGRQDGLAWATRKGRPGSPFAPAFAKALQNRGWAGYRYRILDSQGAAVAWPETYGTTGVMSFLVDESGRIREANLGEQTPAKVQEFKTYAPDSSWRPVP